MNHLERLRSAACLAHTVPGITLQVVTTTDCFVVDRNRLDARMDPCRFRMSLIAPHRPCFPPIKAVIRRCDVLDGAVDLGGGLYLPSLPLSADERWFTTSLGCDQVCAIAETCASDLRDDAFDVVVKPDSDLGVCAVRCSPSRPGPCPQLDEAAFQLLSACVAAEVMAAASSTMRRTSP